MKKLTLILLMGLVFTITGCETMKGLGSDIQKAGKAIEKKAAD
ncbi:MAG: entericidin A/B family lipoprotein [Gammaproteobacteria bacterium]|jgi:predicted small secreted protein|nr:entericidin A/B family lipoprotein [Gammaproteobacteria bacterium]MBT3725618.1 entericidin A/B family lipoprotein [Gammaproteobacteria bacterium]MBT4449544.1 entericidin A/B family lipoprotein [Gammaproteobacteria bacterium]MBT4862529.1 entericidin A/B family lipoprotein [Gammaproteobacteria bacterium]MBT6457220.1 entericidin A/B family lipoprotein [Gammaproteobacteria bacterium]